MDKPLVNIFLIFINNFFTVGVSPTVFPLKKNKEEMVLFNSPMSLICLFSDDKSYLVMD